MSDRALFRCGLSGFRRPEAFRCEHCGTLVEWRDKPTYRPGAFMRLRFCSRRCNAASRIMPAIERFEGRYKVRPNGCWEWKGHKRGGYGTFFDGQRDVNAHRWSWENANGEALGDRVCRHTCDNPSCVNPKHLEPGTQADNLADAAERGRIARGARNSGAKLTEDDIRAIRASTDTLEAIARRFNIVPSAVSNIRHRKRWGHVE